MRKRELEVAFLKGKNPMRPMLYETPNWDDKTEGVKIFDDWLKNNNSVGDYHILSNLTKDQHDSGFSYNGVKRQSQAAKTINQEALPDSERA